jgi:hypothetical protein
MQLALIFRCRVEARSAAFLNPDKLQLTIRTTTGAPVPSNRLTGLEIRTATDITRP